MDRDELIKRIVDEKGEEAIPVLMNLIDNEDSEVAELCLEALVEMGEAGIEAIFNRMKEIVEREEKNDVTALFYVDILGEVAYKKAIPVFYSMLKLYDDEMAQLIIYEALARLGEGKKIAALLSLMLDGVEEADYRDQLIMALSYTGTTEAVEAMGKIYSQPNLDKSTRAFVLEAFHMLLAANSALLSDVKALPEGEEILQKLYLWSKEHHDN